METEDDSRHHLMDLHSAPVIALSYSGMVGFQYRPYEGVQINSLFQAYSSCQAPRHLSITNTRNEPISLRVMSYLRRSKPSRRISSDSKQRYVTFRHRQEPDDWTQRRGPVSHVTERQNIFRMDGKETTYPFGDNIRLSVEPDAAVSFPLRLRVPTWVDEPADIQVNGPPHTTTDGGKMATIERRQTEEDGVTLTLPVSPEAQRAHEQAISMQRGPLVFARAIMGDRRQVDVQHKVPTRAVHPTFPWNRGLRVYPADLADTAALKTGETEDYPWTLDGTSVQLSVPGPPNSLLGRIQGCSRTTAA